MSVNKGNNSEYLETKFCMSKNQTYLPQIGPKSSDTLFLESTLSIF